MGREDWYRSETWNADIEAAFYAKLRRARQKSQYLRIQACHLASTAPTVALRLLDEYFALGDSFDDAQANVDRATAYLVLGDVDAAVAAYEAALKCERLRPNVTTGGHREASATDRVGAAKAPVFARHGADSRSR
jgi:tetratricopeptide (TPR) repeat protein